MTQNSFFLQNDKNVIAWGIFPFFVSQKIWDVFDFIFHSHFWTFPKFPPKTKDQKDKGVIFWKKIKGMYRKDIKGFGAKIKSIQKFLFRIFNF